MFAAFPFAQGWFADAPVVFAGGPLPPIILGVGTLATSEPDVADAESSVVTEDAESGNFRLV